MTPRQQQIYDFIVSYRAEHKYSPTIREIAEMRGVSKTTIFEQVSGLIRDGHLMRDKYKERGLRPAKHRAIQATKIIFDVANRLNEMPNFQAALRRAAGMILSA